MFRIAASRLFDNRCEAEINRIWNELRRLGREFEAMFISHSKFVAETFTRIMSGLSQNPLRERTERSIG